MAVLNPLQEVARLESRRKIDLWKFYPALVTLLLLFAGFFGYWAGVSVESRSQEKSRLILSERDQKILAIITKKNPQATIKDFLGFPAKLTEGAQGLGLDFRYVMALIDKESEWNPKAVSPAGAIGLMQVMPETAALTVRKMGWQGYEPPSPAKASPKYASLGSLGDPEWNIRIGMQFLKWQIDEFGLGPEHLRAYNRGGALAKANWPGDRYAEDIGLKLVVLVNQFSAPSVARQPVPLDRPRAQTAGYPAPEHRRSPGFDPQATVVPKPVWISRR